MDKLINTLCFHLIDISNGAILQLSRYYKLYLLWLKDVGNSLCARFMFQSKWGRNWCFYWLRILWIEIIAFAMGIASCIGMVLFSSVLLGRLKKNSHKVANCQMAHEDNDRLKNIFYLLILDTDSFQNFSDLRINGRSPNTQPYWAPAVKPCVPDEGAEMVPWLILQHNFFLSTDDSVLLFSSSILQH